MELDALERLKNRCHHVISVDIDPIFFKLAGNKDMHNIMNEFEFRPDRTTDYGVSCPWASKKYPYRPYSGENGVSTFSLLFLIGSFWYFVRRTSIKAWMSLNFLKWDLTLAHWTQVSNRCPLGYLFIYLLKADTVCINTPALIIFSPLNHLSESAFCICMQLSPCDVGALEWSYVFFFFFFFEDLLKLNPVQASIQGGWVLNLDYRWKLKRYNNFQNNQSWEVIVRIFVLPPWIFSIWSSSSFDICLYRF